MNRPYIQELGGWGCYPRQKYFFPYEGPDGLRAWYKVLEVYVTMSAFTKCWRNTV